MQFFDLFHSIGLAIILFFTVGIVLLLSQRGNSHKDKKANNRRQMARKTFCEQHNITPREQEVIRLIVQGQRNKEIGATLSITVSTVKKYITRIYQKLEIKSRDELIFLWANPPESLQKNSTHHPIK